MLQKMRLKVGMTQEELAAKAKVDRTYISMLEHVPTLVESENRLLEVVDLLGSAMQNPNRGADDVIVSESICS